MKIKKHISGWFLLAVCLLAACHRDDPEPSYPPGSNEGINQWILDSMQVYYYWNRNLPNRPDLSPAPLDFFSRIKYADDRFSELVNPFEPDTYQQTMTNNFGIDLLAVESNGATALYISLVIPGSVAERSGLQRGQRVLSVNGTAPDAGNAEGIINAAIQNKLAELQIEGIQDPVRLSSGWINENPVHIYKVIGAGTKAGYLFLNHFESGNVPTLLSVFDFFRQQTISELIIDLRYNPGGEVPVAALVAALLAPVKASDIFTEYRGNTNAGTRKNSFDQELSFIGRNVGGLAAHRLNLSRVFLLTGRHTISAAELLVNNLRPYLEVVQIGEQTLGKDMAAFVIQDDRANAASGGWILHPLVYKLYNAQGQGDYAQGLAPDVPVNELSILPLRLLGDETDPLIAAALARMPDIILPSRSLARPATNPIPRILLDTRTEVDKHFSNLTLTSN